MMIGDKAIEVEVDLAEDMMAEDQREENQKENGVNSKAAMMTTTHHQTAHTPSLPEAVDNKSTLAEKEEVERQIWQ